MHIANSIPEPHERTSSEYSECQLLHITPLTPHKLLAHKKDISRLSASTIHRPNQMGPNGNSRLPIEEFVLED